jgi:hypothetical protein
MGVAYNSSIVTNGLVLALDAGNRKSYPGTGTAWTDLSGRGVIGTFNNMDGNNFNSANGGSLTFDGTNEFVACSGSITLTTATFIVWMRRNGNQNQYDGILISRGTNFSGMLLQNSNNLGYTWNGDLAGGNNTYDWSSGLVVPNLSWSMCAISVASSSATAYLYQASGLTTAINNYSHSSSVLDDIKVGQDDFGGRFFNGSISQALIYNRTLTATEIRQNYLATKSRYF